MSLPWLTDIEYGSATEELLAKDMDAELQKHGVVRLTGFPATANELIRLLEHLGTPLRYYGGDTGTHPHHNAIWRVSYDREGARRGEAHAVDGPLAMHSSQSLLEPRPRYFCMLMVNPGWQDQAEGMNGESLLVPWADALRTLSEADPSDYMSMLNTLRSDIPYPDGLTRSVAYSIEPKQNEFDYGIRLKSDLLHHLQEILPGADITQVVKALVKAAQRAALRVQLTAGDLIIVDNNRWGHGRESVIGQLPTGGGGWDVNPRELWSLTLA
ncbi:alpha-ketoglutarate-dependent taurine dioxygenase [Pseudarthrobacter siccitolerans]|uniref:Alpha-ketoglutarate-dependent taurine dioxygenase n=1 Tax=Pseudarthrobacter siccitolerans TaxID=861266 RepID=A0ABU0PL92_9MICC|nr:TauD/TfdA family dioxygenase [Pseudarthrobacter siccitolerans]MDQ0674733.1 alpha-ketoglutarate-dependent taurine dioxygenase [Pseudarthrobacter siccitolerans]